MSVKRSNRESDSKQSGEVTKPKKPAKPKKPHNSPLTVHPSDTWCKRIKGVVVSLRAMGSVKRTRP